MVIYDFIPVSLGKVDRVGADPHRQLSAARWSILPVQDLLGLDADSRINTPGLSP